MLNSLPTQILRPTSRSNQVITSPGTILETYFWLGHDLMWTIHMCRCDEPPEKIIRGLTQINYHLDCLDLHARKSNELLIEAQSTINWNIERKRSIASKLEPLIREAGALAEQNQSN